MKADRFECPLQRDILRQIAADFQIPLWDFDTIAITIPGRGLDIDNVHLTAFYAHDYTSPVAFQRGHGVHNLTALMMMDAIWREVSAKSNGVREQIAHDKFLGERIKDKAFNSWCERVANSSKDLYCCDFPGS